MKALVTLSLALYWHSYWHVHWYVSWHLIEVFTNILIGICCWHFVDMLYWCWLLILECSLTFSWALIWTFLLTFSMASYWHFSSTFVLTSLLTSIVWTCKKTQTSEQKTIRVFINIVKNAIFNENPCVTISATFNENPCVKTKNTNKMKIHYFYCIFAGNCV